MEPTRKGKIARLPAEIRDEVCRRLFDGQTASKILPWLNKLPAVKALLEEDFEGLAVNDQNLSDWRNGGYRDWLRKREQIERTREMALFSTKIAKASGGNLTEGAAAILSGRILEVLEKIDEVLGDAPDGETPDQKKARLILISETIDSLTESLASLRTGDQSNKRLAQNEKRLELIEGRLKQTQEALALEKQKFQRTTCELFIKWFEDKRAADAVSGSGSNTEKIEALGQLMFGDDWRPRDVAH